MSSQNSSLSQNITYVRPPYFFILGLNNVPHAKYYYVFLGFVYLATLLGNSFVMFCIYIERSFHTPKYMVIFNLAVADLCESTALIPNLLSMFLFDSQYISFNACLANMFFVVFFATLQSVSLTILAYDRLVAICFPLRYHSIITMPAIAMILTVVWAFDLGVAILMAILVSKLSFCKSTVVRSYFCDAGPVCRLACDASRPTYTMAIFMLIMFFYVPFILIGLSYWCISTALFKIASWEGRFKAFKTCSTHLMLVAIYYLPLLSTYIAQLFFTIPANVRIMNTSLAKSIIPMMNPIIYVLSTEEVREFSKKLLRIKKKQKQHNRAIKIKEYH